MKTALHIGLRARKQKILRNQMIDLNQVLDANDRVAVGNMYISAAPEKAMTMFNSAMEIDPENLSAICNASFLSMKQKQMPRSLELMNRALAVAPENPHALGISAVVLQENQEFQKAREAFEKSLAIDSGNSTEVATRMLNYAYMLQLVGDYPKALEMYTRARDMNPMDLSARFQRSMCLLTLAESPSQWKQALDEYEIRHVLNPIRAHPPVPMYTGEVPVYEKRIVLLHEQGIGDLVMFSRYARHLKGTGKFSQVHMICAPEAVDLMKLVDGLDTVSDKVDDIPTVDYFVPAMGLMRAENYPKIFVNNTPYLKRQTGSRKRKPGEKLRVGLCWSGNPQHGSARWRDIGSDLFSDTFADMVEDVEFYSLHQPKDNRFRPEFAEECHITTLTALAAVIEQMDAVVTVDTAILHIAGALGKTTYGLIPSNPDWRWQQTGSYTRWYPSVMLLRADKPLNWKPVLEQAKSQLRLDIK